MPLHAADATGLIRTFRDTKRHEINAFYKQNKKSNPKHKQPRPEEGGGGYSQTEQDLSAPFANKTVK